MKLPPLPSVGQIVCWYAGSDRNQDPHAAVVTSVGGDSVCVSIFDKSSYNLQIRDGVRHLDDERSRKDYGREVGAWDYTDRDKLLDLLLNKKG